MTLRNFDLPFYPIRKFRQQRRRGWIKNGMVHTDVNSASDSASWRVGMCKLLHEQHNFEGFLCTNQSVHQSLFCDIRGALSDKLAAQLLSSFSLQCRCFPWFHELSVLAGDWVNSPPCWLRKSVRGGGGGRRWGKNICSHGLWKHETPPNQLWFTDLPEMINQFVKMN